MSEAPKERWSVSRCATEGASIGRPPAATDLDEVRPAGTIRFIGVPRMYEVGQRGSAVADESFREPLTAEAVVITGGRPVGKNPRS